MQTKIIDSKFFRKINYLLFIIIFINFNLAENNKINLCLWQIIYLNLNYFIVINYVELKKLILSDLEKDWEKYLCIC